MRVRTIEATVTATDPKQARSQGTGKGRSTDLHEEYHEQNRVQYHGEIVEEGEKGACSP